MVAGELIHRLSDAQVMRRVVDCLLGCFGWLLNCLVRCLLDWLQRIIIDFLWLQDAKEYRMQSNHVFLLGLMQHRQSSDGSSKTSMATAKLR